jgi:hypothetical protein
MERLTTSIGTFAGFSLSGDQAEVFSRIVNAYDPNDRRVFVVRGGPGSGKTVIALQLLREFYTRGIPAFYFASSQAVVNAYRTAFHESRSVFSNSITVGRTTVPVQIIDEAHRLHDSKQIKRAIKSAALSVFLIDDQQVILPADIKGHREITVSAASCGPHDAIVLDLTGDKRTGAESYVGWIDAALGIPTPARPMVSPQYRFGIVESPHELETRLRECGGHWRIVAGMCWPRSDPTESGQLVDDVFIPEFDYRRPWSGNHKKLHGSPLYQAALCWATEPCANSYIGNVYTAQSFEFDYVGFIFGKDLVRRRGDWEPDLAHHPKTDHRFYSEGAFARRSREFLRNIYRVLLTRGRYGCFVFFHDPETRAYFQRLVEIGGPAM